jgi:hypothetical protein
MSEALDWTQDGTPAPKLGKDKPCIYCGVGVYYSYGAKGWWHEGRRPSLRHRLPIGGDWGKWTDCEDDAGNPTGTKATSPTSPASSVPVEEGQRFEAWLPESGWDQWHTFSRDQVLDLMRETWNAALASRTDKEKREDTTDVCLVRPVGGGVLGQEEPNLVSLPITDDRDFDHVDPRLKEQADLVISLASRTDGGNDAIR